MVKIKHKLTRKNIANGLLFAFLLLFIFVPAAKAYMMEGLITVGLFDPAVDETPKIRNGDLTSIKFKDAKGQTVSLADLKGKVIFLNVWATWCPPCLAEMPSIHRFYKQFEGDKDLVFLMVDADGDFKKAQAYMDRKRYQLPVYTFASNIPANIFKGSLPTTVVFDKQGRISFQGKVLRTIRVRNLLTLLRS